VKHYPKIEVFATKGLKLRARIKESPEEPLYEVTIGGREWFNGKGRQHEAIIKDKANYLVSTLLAQYENFFEGLDRALVEEGPWGG